MRKNMANVLLLGNSGVGKSTLINAVLDNDVARISLGERGTDKMDIYEGGGVPFRLIDSKGMEYSHLSQTSARRQIEKWMKDNLDAEDSEKCVSMIWYCVDAMSARLFEENIKLLRGVTRFWKDVPVIVVLTKSYSEPQRDAFEDIVYRQIQKYGKGRINVRGVISVVAKELPINDTTVVPPYGLERLVDKTVDLTPEALRMADSAVMDYKLGVKRRTAHGLTLAITAGSAAVGASPVPVADEVILVPAQTALVRSIAKIYDVPSKDSSLIKTIVECGTVSIPARAAVSSLKAALPGVGNAINAVVAAVFSGAIGEITIAVMENIYTGRIDEKDLKWVRKFTESEFRKTIAKKLPMLKGITNIDMTDMKSVGKFVADLFKTK